MNAESKTEAGELISSQKLVGYKVENLQGKSLGRIEDIMISPEEGKVAYAVVSFGGVLRLGNKHLAFPWSALRVDNLRKTVLIDLDRKTLSKVHGFDKNHWPASSSWDWDTEVSTPPLSSVLGTTLTVPSEPRTTASGMPVEKRMDHWGESWQSHGLDRR
jgi:sporulation protein YlmC with PRC-barrel domain